jgi:hypothetical protein
MLSINKIHPSGPRRMPHFAWVAFLPEQLPPRHNVQVLIQNIDSPFKWLRLLPAEAFAGWDLHPLESAALSRRTPDADITPITELQASELQLFAFA